MPPLPSGLPEVVADEEMLTRFINSASRFNATMAKPAAFLPHPAHKNSSVFRMDGRDAIHANHVYGETSHSEQSLKAVAICTAATVRAQELDVVAQEPPPRHANIEGWNWDSDPQMAKAHQKQQAGAIASKSDLVIFG